MHNEYNMNKNLFVKYIDIHYALTKLLIFIYI